MSYRNELIQVAAVAIAALQNLDEGTTALIEAEGHYGFEAQELILDEIRAHRRWQEEKWGTRSEEPRQWLTILVEEVGEVARAILERDGI